MSDPFCEPPPQDTSTIHQGQDWLYRLSRAICQLGGIVNKLESAPPSSGKVSITATNPIVVTPSPLTNTGVVSHAASGVTAATYGDANNIGQFTVEADGHVTSATNVPFAGPSSFTLAYLFGDGRDGNFVLDGTNTYSQLNKSGNNYTCNQWLMANNVTINANCTLHNGNNPIFIKGTLTNNGKIGSWGADAVNGIGGAGVAISFFPITTAGANASATGGAGTTVTSPTLTLGGGGGNGGAGVAAAGSGAATTPPGAAAGGTKCGVWVLYAMLNTLTTAVGHISPFNQCAGPGASGGGDNSGSRTGGGGGAAAGWCFIAALTLAGNGTVSSAGGQGGNGTGAGASGAGGGGGGGCLWFCTTTPSPTTINTFTVAGGAHGTPANGGGTGTNGTAGNQYVFVGT